MKNKAIILTLMIFVLITSLIYAKDTEEIINKQELNKIIEAQIQQTLSTRETKGNWLNEDPLGYISINELKYVYQNVLDVLKYDKVNFKYMSDKSQFDVISYIVSMNDKKVFKQVIEKGFNPLLRETLNAERQANIFTQIILSENKDALDYLYLTLPTEVLTEEMYFALQTLIKVDNKYGNLSDNWYAMINSKYRNKSAISEDLAHAVLYGHIEGAEELKIAYNSIPEKSKLQELYGAFLNLIYYRRDNISNK